MIYKPKDIEQKWQEYWEREKTFATPSDATKDNKYYILPQLPYPSGSGLHVGHAEVYTACDILARFKRMQGEKVLQVIGWDSFGLPAENYAIKTNVHPRESTEQAVNNFRSQIKALGISVDWNRETGSHTPEYYKWTQWLFQLMYRQGLAYRKKQAVNWCESCKTVLANEQVDNGHCERCDTVVIQKEMEQWYLRITDYADRLLEGLDRIDWPEETKKRQRDWIGRSEGAIIRFKVCHAERPAGVEVSPVNIEKQGDPSTTLRFAQDDGGVIEVFTTRPDTIFGVTYMVLAPEHALVSEWLAAGKIENVDEVTAYIDSTSKKTDLDRQIDQEKTGVELNGITAINPVNNEEIPVWIADYVLASYGTGAIMAVPAHDERDFAFAKKFGLEIREVVAPHIVLTGDCTPKEDKTTLKKDVVSAIVRNPKTDEFLVLEWAADRKGFVGGGVESNESFEEAILREVIEETGYTELKIIDVIISNLYGHGYKPRKDVNCFDLDKVFLIDILDVNKRVTSESDTDAHTILWCKKNEVKGNLTLDHHVFMWDWFSNKKEYFGGTGIVINSDFLNEKTTDKAKETIIAWLEEHGKGSRKINYKLRDWSVSRQRFWGAPIPMVRHTETGELKLVPETDLPVRLPDDVDFKPTGQSPLTYSQTFQNGVEDQYGKGWQREVDTLDTFMCSSWYFFRYLDPHNDTAFASPEALKAWMPVDFYLGGAEHVNGHLLYSRFLTKVLYDAGYIDFDEPFTVHRHQGLILGEDNRKMSKRWGNVINPTDVIAEYGADTCRMYEMFMGPLEETKPWDTNGVKGVRRFLDRVWRFVIDEDTSELSGRVVDAATSEEDMMLHKTIKKVSSDTALLGFNTAIASMMEFVNFIYKQDTISRASLHNFVLLLAPYAPHMAEELWSILGNGESIAVAPWPTYDERKLVADTMTIVVQINGKVREQLEVSSTITKEEAEAAALASEKVQGWLDGKEPKKIIYVPGKLVSIVV